MKILATAVLTFVALGAAACGDQTPERAERPGSRAATSRAPEAEQELPPTPLVAEVATRDLGTLGISDGTVETTFRVSNGTAEPVQLVAVFTSCMCTEAVLEFQDGTTAGPFGMPGHELPVTLARTLAAGEAFDVRATFDPMAHGPDAVGPVKRAIALRSGNGGMLQLDFTVNVVQQVADGSR